MKNNLDQAEENLPAFKKQYGISSSLKEERALLLQKNVTLEAALNETIGQEVEVEKRIEQLNDQLSNTSKHPTAISALWERLLTLQLKVSEIVNQLQ